MPGDGIQLFLAFLLDFLQEGLQPPLQQESLYFSTVRGYLRIYGDFGLRGNQVQKDGRLTQPHFARIGNFYDEELPVQRVSALVVDGGRVDLEAGGRTAIQIVEYCTPTKVCLRKIPGGPMRRGRAGRIRLAPARARRR